MSRNQLGNLFWQIVLVVGGCTFAYIFFAWCVDGYW